MKNKERKQKFEDDGRRIADMNVEGMTWRSEERRGGKECVGTGISRCAG